MALFQGSCHCGACRFEIETVLDHVYPTLVPREAPSTKRTPREKSA